jgi:sphinganine-1-phosphate aldolase
MLAMGVIPEVGADPRALLQQMRAFQADDANWRNGRCFCLVYDPGDAHHAILKEAHNAFFSENGLNPMAFQSVKRMEQDVVKMAASLLHGDSRVVGTMTTGGTESLLLAVKAARERAKKTKPWLLSPEMVLPISAHVALDKAGHYFGVKIRWAPMRDDFRVDVSAVKKLINRNTVLIVGSAPQYPHGVIDPITELAAIAKKRDIPLHVDACVGGFMLPFLEQLGETIAPWDFRVDGVTSISADLHKYGYTAKGASVLLYRNMEYLKHQFFVSTDWPGGVYASPTIPGTRPAGPIAAAWAGLQAMGMTGYRDKTRAALEAANRLKGGLRAIPGLRILGSEQCTLVAFGGDADVDAFAVADLLQAKRWHFDRVQQPAGIHLTVMAGHGVVVDEFLSDVAEAVAHVRKHPELKSRGEAQMYGMMAKIPFRFMVRDAAEQFMTQLYGSDGVPGVGGGDRAVDKFLAKYGDEVRTVIDKVDNAKAAAQRLRKRVSKRLGS